MLEIVSIISVRFIYYLIFFFYINRRLGNEIVEVRKWDIEGGT